MSDSTHDQPTDEPTTDELEEPSTEKDPGEQPEAPVDATEATHQAAGIGVIGGPLTHIGEDGPPED